MTKEDKEDKEDYRVCRRATTVSRHDDTVDGVSVIMVSYWTGSVLFAAIEAVLNQGQNRVVELILIDNGNPLAVTVGLAQRAEAEPRLKFVSGHGNVGFSRGCNMGANRARGRYLLLLNPDCCLGIGTISGLLAEAAALGDHWMLGCRLSNLDGGDQRGARRSLLTPYTALVEGLRLDRLVGGIFCHHRLNLHESLPPSECVRVPAISGACMMLPAATFRMVGGMDEGYFLHVEDLDLCLRLHKVGVPVYYSPHFGATHHSSSSRANPIWIEWCKTRGFLRYFRMHYCTPLWVTWLVPLSVGILIRFGAKAMRLLLHSIWNRRNGMDASPFDAEM